VEEQANWKLKLQDGREATPYTHYTLIAEGVVEGELDHGFKCPRGKAFMGLKVWATDANEAAEMIHSIASQIGFKITGRIESFETDPEEPPGEDPHGYGINFTPFK